MKRGLIHGLPLGLIGWTLLFAGIVWAPQVAIGALLAMVFYLAIVLR